MKIVDLAKEQLDLPTLLDIAQHEPVLLLTTNGEEFLLAEADDFEQEVAALRASYTFQAFLDERSRSPRTTSLDELEREIEQELAAQQSAE
jgi:PHD/YefM family antitoxin component YafN of YafNO toxin-antitoxin module